MAKLLVLWKPKLIALLNRKDLINHLHYELLNLKIRISNSFKYSNPSNVVTTLTHVKIILLNLKQGFMVIVV